MTNKYCWNKIFRTLLFYSSDDNAAQTSYFVKCWSNNFFVKLWLDDAFSSTELVFLLACSLKEVFVYISVLQIYFMIKYIHINSLKKKINCHIRYFWLFNPAALLYTTSTQSWQMFCQSMVLSHQQAQHWAHIWACSLQSVFCHSSFGHIFTEQITPLTKFLMRPSEISFHLAF